MIGWVDASSGASGDMLLGALLDAGVPVEVLASTVAAVAPEPVSLRPERVTRSGFTAVRCHVEPADSGTHRRWSDVAALLAEADLPDAVRRRAQATFERLAAAEATVHGIPMSDVEFHEVGALDAIADVVGVCAGLEHLALRELVVSPVAVGSGAVRGSHGSLPVPPPAVAELMRGAPSYAGQVPFEMCTPTGAALLVVNATSFGPQPAMTVHRVGVGAGHRDPAGHPNVLRLFVGEAVPSVPPSGHSLPSPEAGPTDPVATTATVLETNVDDQDPRLWPNVLAALLAAGASDAWLSPILMKKGRPAHTLSALVDETHLDQVRAEFFRQTSTLGLREIAVSKLALPRRLESVSVTGHRVRVKLAVLRNSVVTAQPEYDDVVLVAEATGRPVKDVLADAVAAARQTGGA